MPAVDSDNASRKLLQAREQADEASNRYHARRLTFVMIVLCLGPVAVGLLAAHTVFDRDGGRLAVLLVALELFFLAAALCVSYLNLGRDHEHWISSRLRTEMLRREEWLLFARVGPYAGVVAGEERVDERLTALNNQAAEPTELLPMMSPLRKMWRDTLEDDADSATSSDTLVADMRTYGKQRIEVQRSWFAEKSKEHAHNGEWLEWGAKLTLAAAFLLAALHLGLLLGTVPATLKPAEHVMLFAALWLPAVGSAFIAFRSVLGCQRLALAYDHYATALNALHQSLLDLLESPINSTRASLQFRRTVLDVEQLLTEELRQWWLNMAPKQPRAH